MVRQLKWLLPVFLLLLLAGTATPSEYTYRDGFYWLGEVPYTRQKVQYTTPGYYQCGYYYPGTVSYRYEYTRAAVYTPPAPPRYGPGWKEQALKYAEYRDDLAAYLKTLDALGIQGQQYSFQQGYHYPQMNYATGQTAYGYTYQAVKEAYGQTDLNTLYQQASRLAQGAQGLGGQATAEFQSLVAQAGENQAKVAEILAKAQAVRAIMEGVRPEPRVKETTTINGVAMPPAGAATALTVLNSRCASCHSGAQKKGTFDVAQWNQLTDDQRAGVLARVLTDDDARRMPRKPDGSAGKLTGPEVIALAGK